MSVMYSALDDRANRPALRVAPVTPERRCADVSDELAKLDAQITELQARRFNLLGKVPLTFEEKAARTMDAVARNFGVTRSEVLGRTRTMRIADARHAYLSLLIEWSGFRDLEIAASVHRNRSVCSYARRGVMNRCRCDRSFRERYSAAREAIGLEPLP